MSKVNSPRFLLDKEVEDELHFGYICLANTSCTLLSHNCFRFRYKSNRNLIRFLPRPKNKLHNFKTEISGRKHRVEKDRRKYMKELFAVIFSIILHEFSTGRSSMIRIGHCVPWTVHLRCYSFDLANKGLEVQFYWSWTIYYSFKEKIKHQITYKTNERLERPFLKNCFIITELSNPAREDSRRKHLSTANGNDYFGTHSFVLINAWMDKSYFHSGVKICLLILNVLFTSTFFKSTPR